MIDNKKKILNALWVWLVVFLFFLIWSIFPSVIIIGLHKITEINTLTEELILILFAFLYMITLFIIYKKSIVDDFKAFTKKLIPNLEESLKWFIMGFLFMITSNLLIFIFSPNIASLNEVVVRESFKLKPYFMFFSVLIFAPFVEEIIFRKSLRQAIPNKWIFIIISSLLFGILHVLTEDARIWNLLYLISYFGYSFFISLAYSKTNNIFTSICIHFFNNSFTILILLLSGALI